MQVSASLWGLSGSRSCSSKEGVKDITKATEIESLEAAAKELFSGTVSEAVIGSTLIWIGEYFVGFAYLLKFFFCPVITVAVRMILEG